VLAGSRAGVESLFAAVLAGSASLVAVEQGAGPDRLGRALAEEDQEWAGALAVSLAGRRHALEEVLAEADGGLRRSDAGGLSDVSRIASPPDG
jgi:hypothetical protein